MPEHMSLIIDAGTTPDMPLRMCPECKQTGRGRRCRHYDITGERVIPTVPVDSPASRETHDGEETDRG